ncbi:MAG: ATP-binding cassette domain-containing protein, partial [Bdellovibrionota bacterium]
MSTPLLEVRNLRKTYDLRRLFQKPAHVKALDGVSFSLVKGKTLAIVGESGCGKSTLAKCLMLIESITSGDAIFGGRSVSQTPAGEWREQVQMIFQDPYSSLNPRKKCIDIVSEPLVIAGGLQNMSQVPHYLENSRGGFRMGHQKIMDGMIKDGLWDPYNDYHM